VAETPPGCPQALSSGFRLLPPRAIVEAIEGGGAAAESIDRHRGSWSERGARMFAFQSIFHHGRWDWPAAVSSTWEKLPPKNPGEIRSPENRSRASGPGIQLAALGHQLCSRLPSGAQIAALAQAGGSPVSTNTGSAGEGYRDGCPLASKVGTKQSCSTTGWRPPQWTGPARGHATELRAA